MNILYTLMKLDAKAGAHGLSRTEVNGANYLYQKLPVHLQKDVHELEYLCPYIEGVN